MARIMEDRELIMYGLVNQKEQIKLDDSLSGKKRKRKLKKLIPSYPNMKRKKRN
ncbi:hypothetical protein KEH51_23945 [[Brevibacterium] frigoritolerans]|uniref:Uncharacterized protein n=1 Tax=Peribacillus frigoritolerans TaxID=450367 RepID=A0A941FKM6_9BACI|nr:hypothetical protein [Peribacillus frigoritolerans]